MSTLKSVKSEMLFVVVDDRLDIFMGKIFLMMMVEDGKREREREQDPMANVDKSFFYASIIWGGLRANYKFSHAFHSHINKI